MNGYPGSESSARKAMLKVMGQEHYDYFFDRLIHHFFTEDDAKLLKSLRINSVRIPFSYKHFEDDMNPRVLKEASGFRYLDRMIDICSANGIYSILDMHAVPGAQNPDWHSDNHTSYAAFWDFKDHQDRTVWLWEQIALRYAGNTWVAGYNPMNEPCDPEHTRLPAFYERVAQAIRSVDPNHMLFLDGNTFAMEWKGFDEVIPNTVYSVHDYSLMGFPIGARFKGLPEQKEKLRQQFARKCEFHHRHNVPVWVGEFGPTYQKNGPEVDEINAERYNLLREQLDIYEKEEHVSSWSIWLYKDIGVMGMVSTSPDSAWMKLLQPFIEKKNKLKVDSFTSSPSPEIDGLITQLSKWIDQVSPSATKTYPSNWNTEQHVRRNVLQTFLASTLCDEYASLFKGKDKADLEELAASYALRNCVQRKGLNDILAERAAA